MNRARARGKRQEARGKRQKARLISTKKGSATLTSIILLSVWSSLNFFTQKNELKNKVKNDWKLWPFMYIYNPALNMKQQ